MGAGADDRLTHRFDCDAAGLPRDGSSQIYAQAAEEYAQSEGMPYKEALKVITGQTRRPYGSPKL